MKLFKSCLSKALSFESDALGDPLLIALTDPIRRVLNDYLFNSVCRVLMSPSNVDKWTKKLKAVLV